MLVEHTADASCHDLSRSDASPPSAVSDVVVAPASASAAAAALDCLHPLDSHSRRSVVATTTDIGAPQPGGYRAAGSGSLIAGYAVDSCEQRVRGCGGGGVPGVVRPQAVEIW